MTTQRVMDLIVEDATKVLMLYSTPAQDAIAAGLYGPREAQFAMLVVRLVAERVAVAEEVAAEETATEEETDSIKELVEALTAAQTQLKLLTQLVVERLAGGEDITQDACDLLDTLDDLIQDHTPLAEEASPS